MTPPGRLGVKRPTSQSSARLLGIALAVPGAWCALGQTLLPQVPGPARGLEVVEHLGDALPLETVFTDSSGRAVRLGDYFPGAGGKPAIVAMVYYRCPVACPTVMAKLTESLNQVDFTVGKDFNALLFGFKDEETTIDSAGAKARFTSGYPRAADPEVSAGWQFHTGSAEANLKLGEALGFPYRRLESGEYSHPICIFVISPAGKVCRYVYGYDYEPSMLKLALLEATDGKIARTIGERFAHLCYRYDPTAGTYTLQAFRVMQVGGGLTVLGIAALVGGLRLNEAFRRRGGGQPPSGPGTGAAR